MRPIWEEITMTLAEARAVDRGVSFPMGAVPRDYNFAADLIERNQAGVRLTDPADIVPILKQLLENRGQYLAMRAAAQALAIPDATHRIVTELSGLLGPEMKKQPQKAAGGKLKSWALCST